MAIWIEARRVRRDEGGDDELVQYDLGFTDHELGSFLVDRGTLEVVDMRVDDPARYRHNLEKILRVLLPRLASGEVPDRVTYKH